MLTHSKKGGYLANPNKKKAFTLIELLAVIVILAVIALIATPLIMDIINSAKEESIKRSVEQIQGAAETTYAAGQIKDPNYVFNQSDVKYKGEQFADIAMDVNETGNASVAVYKDNKCYYALNSERKVTVDNTAKDECLDKVNSGSLPSAIHMTKEEATTAGYEVELLDNNTYALRKVPQNIETIKIPTTVDGIKITSIGLHQNNLASVMKKVVIPYGVEKIEDRAFMLCPMATIVIPDSVTSIGINAFDNCTKLTSVIIPDSVTSIGDWAFNYCTSLNSVKFSNSITTIPAMAFAHCESLTSVTIPNSVTSIGEGAFGNCTNLTSVTIPDSVTSIERHAFLFCISLTSVTIPNSVTSIGVGAFVNVERIYYEGTATGEPWGANYVNDIFYGGTGGA